MPELTDWFHPPVSPVRVGVYQIRDQRRGDIFYSKWDGRQWHWGWLSGAMAAKENNPRYGYRPSWRGLKEEPE